MLGYDNYTTSHTFENLSLRTFIGWLNQEFQTQMDVDLANAGETDVNDETHNLHGGVKMART